jgi:hypothetical protein
MFRLFVDVKKAREFLIKSDLQLFDGLKTGEIENDWSDEKCLWVANAEVFLLTGQGDEDAYERLAGKKPEK